MCLYIINMKRKSKVDHCGNKVGLTSKPTCIRRMKSLLYMDEAYIDALIWNSLSKIIIIYETESISKCVQCSWKPLWNAGHLKKKFYSHWILYKNWLPRWVAMSDICSLSALLCFCIHLFCKIYQHVVNALQFSDI